MKTPTAIQKLRIMDTDELDRLFEQAKADPSVPLRVLAWISGEYDRRIRARAGN